MATTVDQIRGSRSQALWLATLGFFGGFAGVSVFGPLVPEFKDILELSAFQASMLAAIPALTGSLLRIPFGAAVEQSGGRRPFLGLLGLTCLGMVGLLVLMVTSYPDDPANPQPGDMDGMYPVLLVLGALIGCGIATFSVGVGQVSYWFPTKDQGGALGAYAGLGNTSPGLSTMLLPIAVGGMGIVSAYSIWFAILVGVTILYAVFIRDAPWFQYKRRGEILTAQELAERDNRGTEMVPTGTAVQGLKDASRSPATWVLVFFYFLSFGGFLAFTTWLPTFWHETYDATLHEAGLLTAAFSLLSALIRVPGGLLSDRISIRYALTGNYLLMLIGTLVLSFADTFAISLAATIAVGLGMGLQSAIVFKLLPRYVPHAVGGASGWVGGLGAFGGFVIPPLMGIVAGSVGGTEGYARGFIPFAILIVIALPVVIWLKRWSAREGLMIE